MYKMIAITFPTVPDSDRTRKPAPICSKGNAIKVENRPDRLRCKIQNRTQAAASTDKRVNKCLSFMGDLLFADIEKIR